MDQFWRLFYSTLHNDNDTRASEASEVKLITSEKPHLWKLTKLEEVHQKVRGFWSIMVGVGQVCNVI